ncbi:MULTISPECIES: hypothetical protein [Streptomyces]|uniref:Uncharacterized protein n=1 Tax=Streptomyces viridochromogenes TaxID=1938 RepID=A0A0L8LC30_STRVR|nr:MULTISPECIES: hypothetical protein [Streptomyces]KOG35669.1 hypothetical protein ADK34_04785 [Streptomyces viridochromogenes]
MISCADEFLAALDSLSHTGRLRYTAVTAHRLAARGELRPLLAALDGRGSYERRLAALAALTAGESHHLAARLGDPDPVVRRYALRGARRLPVPEAAIEAAYDDAPAVVRADLARLLRDGRRPGLAERLALRVRTAYGDRDAARLLPGCSTEFAARLLPELAGALAFEDWSTLAVRHPVVVLDHVERELRDLPLRSRERWWARHASAIAAAVPAAPARVLELLERYGPDNLPGPVNDCLGALVSVDAERVARWLADPRRAAARWERTPGRAVIRKLVAADPPSLPAVGARWFHREAFAVLVRSVPPARRAGFVDAVIAAGGPRLARHAHERVLVPLPAAERHVRVRAAVEEMRAEPHSGWDLWGLLALLPPAEARPELLRALGTGDAEERGTLWDRLMVNADLTRDPEQVAEVLALAAGRVANDRDPVREEALSAVADLPAPLLVAATESGTPTGGVIGAVSLEKLCLDALRARDSSSATRRTIGTLAVNLLAAAGEAAAVGSVAAAGPDAPAGASGGAALRTAVRVLEALTAHTGRVDLGRIGGVLRDGGTRAVLDALGPWLDRAASRGDVSPLLSLVTSCGRHAYRIPELQDRLEQALRTCPDAVFGKVAAAWLGDPATRGGRVAELLAWEPSAVFLPEVLAVVASERSDLLDRALVGLPPSDGRFPVAGTVRPLPPFRYADRWLPRQQEAAVRLASAVVADPGRGLDERAGLLRSVASVPEHGRALLGRYADFVPAAAEADDVTGAAGESGAVGTEGTVGSPVGRAEADLTAAALAAAALDAAADTDDPASALPALLGHLGDDRAAAAWSAAARAAAHARPSRVAALLRDVLTRENGVKVTVRKAAARLAARHLPPGAAIELLYAVGRAPGVHPDVHATVVGLASTLLPAEEMWALLESAVADGPDASRRMLLEVGPADLLPAHRSRYGELVARLPFVAEEQTAEQALYGLRDWARYAPGAGAALADVYTDPASPLAGWRACHGLVELAQSGLPHPIGGVAPGSLLGDVVDRLLAVVAAGEPEGGGRGGDLPARRRLDSLLGSSIRDPRMCAVLARRLATEPAVTAARTALLVRAVDLTSTEAELIFSLRELAAATEGRPVLAVRVAEDLEEAHQYGDPLHDLSPALAAVRVLASEGRLVEGLLAVGLVTALGVRKDWPDSCRAAVVELRRHPELEVREAAYVTDLGGR